MVLASFEGCVLMALFLREAAERIESDDVPGRIDRLMDRWSFSPAAGLGDALRQTDRETPSGSRHASARFFGLAGTRARPAIAAIGQNLLDAASRIARNP